MLEIALRNPSGALRTGIGFRFCRGAAANGACPMRELVLGGNRPFPQQGGGCGRRGQHTAAWLLPAHIAAAAELHSTILCVCGGEHLTGTRSSPICAWHPAPTPQGPCSRLLSGIP